MTFYIDIDDVMCETAATLCLLAEREFGRHVPYEEVREFDLQRVFGLTDVEMKRFSYLSHTPESLLSYPETPGAADGVRRLREDGHDISFVTGRPSFTFEATEEWLRRAGLEGYPVTYVDKYGRYTDPIPGAPRMVTLEELLARHYDVAIDDSPVVLPHLATWDRTRVLVIDRPWNAAYPLAPNMTRVKNWSDLLLGV